MMSWEFAAAIGNAPNLVNVKALAAIPECPPNRSIQVEGIVIHQALCTEAVKLCVLGPEFQQCRKYVGPFADQPAQVASVADDRYIQSICPERSRSLSEFYSGPDARLQFGKVYFLLQPYPESRRSYQLIFH